MGANDEILRGYLRENEKLLLSLEEVVNPKHTALIVVDMQNDFVHGRGNTKPTPGKPLKANEKMSVNLVKFVDVCRRVGVPIFWVITHHGRDVDLPAYKARMARRNEAPQGLEGTKGAELISGLGIEKGERVFINHSFDGFTGTDLDICLKNRGIVSLIMSGNATNTCVDATLKHAFHLGYYIVDGSDITSTGYEGTQEIYLESFARHYGLVATCEEISKVWGEKLK